MNPNKFRRNRISNPKQSQTTLCLSNANGHATKTISKSNPQTNDLSMYLEKNQFISFQSHCVCVVMINEAKQP